MKIIIVFLVLISLVTCEPVPNLTAIAPAEVVFIDIKKSILICISNNKTATQELRQYAIESLYSGDKKALNFDRYREKDSDNNIIKQCRRKALIYPIKKHINLPKPLTIKDNVVPK